MPPSRPRRLLSAVNHCPDLAFDPQPLRKLFDTLDRWSRRCIPAGELSVAFLDDDAIGEIHQRYLGDPSPTDVITFPGDPGLGDAGEILVGAETAARQADLRDLTFDREMQLYLIHGWLHLAGEDDRLPGPRRAMRTAEKEAFDYLASKGIGAPIFRWGR